MFKKFFRFFFNPKAWMGYDHLVAQNRFLRNTLKKIFIPGQASHTESFKEAVQRLQLSEQALKEKMNSFKRLSTFFIAMSLIVFLYAIYLYSQALYFPALITVLLGFVLVVQSFRYHFWYMQIRKEKLGCTFREWLQFILKGSR